MTTQLTKKETIARMYEHLTTGSILGGLARSLFMNYPKTANAVLWVAVTEHAIESVHVTFMTDHSFKFAREDFWYSLSETTDSEKALLEEVLPELKDFP